MFHAIGSVSRISPKGIYQAITDYDKNTNTYTLKSALVHCDRSPLVLSPVDFEDFLAALRREHNWRYKGIGEGAEVDIQSTGYGSIFSISHGKYILDSGCVDTIGRVIGKVPHGFLYEPDSGMIITWSAKDEDMVVALQDNSALLSFGIMCLIAEEMQDLNALLAEGISPIVIDSRNLFFSRTDDHHLLRERSRGFIIHQSPFQWSDLVPHNCRALPKTS